MMTTRALRCTFPLLLAAVAAACGGSSRAEPPVASAAITVNRPRVALGSPVELTYEFKVADGAAFDQDYRVFVHFVDADDELMWTDDHVPPTPTSQWKPGQVVKYTRLLFVPVYPYVGDAAIDIGLYAPDGRRLPLAGTERGQRAYRVATVQISPQTDNIYLTYKDGWHLAEIAGDNAGNEWHWTKKDATLAFKNPRRDATLYLDVDGQTRLLPSPQVVTMSIGSQTVASFPLAGSQEVHRIPITAAQFGAEEKVELKIGVDRTFVPAVVTAGNQKDTRELGIRVFHAFVEPK
ncbi:MAG: hypothetical protein EHM24_10560 [Acidobacteria bacterium]|nr:MAG: hypothetical protein EHM24_10560 [Acidobacteriota bacterium]